MIALESRQWIIYDSRKHTKNHGDRSAIGFLFVVLRVTPQIITAKNHGDRSATGFLFVALCVSQWIINYVPVGPRSTVLGVAIAARPASIPSAPSSATRLPRLNSVPEPKSR